MIDDRHLDASELGHTTRPKAHLQEFDNAPAGLLFRGIFAVRPKAQEEMVRS
jgi:hypothetical protein